jgi:hemerythrin superfamily protein
MPDSVIEILKADHAEARMLLKELMEPRPREGLLEEIRHALTTHTTVEEEIVYPAYRKILGDHDADVLVEESLTEHALVERILDDLGRMPSGTTRFQGKATVLHELVDHHARDEEKEMFPKLRRHTSKSRLEELGKKVMARKQELKLEQRVHAARSLQGMSKEELYAKAREQGIEGRSRMGKDELRNALR